MKKINAELQACRNKAQEAFDTLWENGKMSRTAASKFLANKLGVAEGSCNIDTFDADYCVAVVDICSNPVYYITKDNYKSELLKLRLEEEQLDGMPRLLIRIECSEAFSKKLDKTLYLHTLGNTYIIVEDIDCAVIKENKDTDWPPETVNEYTLIANNKLTYALLKEMQVADEPSHGSVFIVRHSYILKEGTI